MVEVKQKRGR